jgi:hypothetical protein
MFCTLHFTPPVEEKCAQFIQTFDPSASLGFVGHQDTHGHVTTCILVLLYPVTLDVIYNLFHHPE